MLESFRHWAVKMNIWCTRGHIRCFSKKGRTGRSTFGGVRKDGQVVKEGPFLFTGSYRDSLGMAGRFRAHGKFLHGEKTGVWAYKSVKTKRSKTLLVEYVRGRQNGVYQLTTVNHRFGIIPIRLSLSMHMVDGKPSGPFSAKAAGDHCWGAFDEEGRPHGSWMLNTRSQTGVKKRIEEVWAHGRLLSGQECMRGKEIAYSQRSQILDRLYSVLHGGMSLEKVCDMGSSPVSLYTVDTKK